MVSAIGLLETGVGHNGVRGRGIIRTGVQLLPPLVIYEELGGARRRAVGGSYGRAPLPARPRCEQYSSGTEDRTKAHWRTVQESERAARNLFRALNDGSLLLMEDQVHLLNQKVAELVQYRMYVLMTPGSYLSLWSCDLKRCYSFAVGRAPRQTA